MMPINFCKHVRKQFTKERKRVERECAREREKKARDEFLRQHPQVKQDE